MPEAQVRGRAVVGAVADDHAGRARPHQVQGGLVVAATADEHRHVERGDERLQVELGRGLLGRRDVLGRDDGALDDEQVDAFGEDVRRQLDGVLRREPHRDPHAGVAQLADPLAQQLGRHRLAVEPLQAGRGRVERGQLLVGVGVARPQPLAVEHGQAAEALDLDRGRRRDHRVRRRDHQRDVEGQRVDLPAGRHHLGAAGAPAGHEGELVQVVTPAHAASQADLDCLWHSRKSAASADTT